MKTKFYLKNKLNGAIFNKKFQSEDDAKFYLYLQASEYDISNIEVIEK